MANRIALDGGEAVHAQAVAPSPWTAAGSTGVGDESTVGRYSFTNASAGFLGGIASINPLELRYNVTNTYDNNSSPAAPGWTTLELGAQAPGGSVVGAFFYKVSLCTGADSALLHARQCGLRGHLHPSVLSQPAASISAKPSIMLLC